MRGFILIEIVVAFLSFAIPATVLYAVLFEDIKPAGYYEAVIAAPDP